MITPDPNCCCEGPLRSEPGSGQSFLVAQHCSRSINKYSLSVISIEKVSSVGTYFTDFDLYTIKDFLKKIRTPSKIIYVNISGTP